MFELPKYDQTRKSFSDGFSHWIFMNIFTYTTVLRTTKEIEGAFQILREHAEKTLKRSAYQNIKLAEVFRKLNPMPSSAPA